MTTTVAIHQSIEPLVGEWEELARRSNASPFLWPGWMKAWWHAFGAGRLQILTVYQNGHLAGVLPLLRLRGALKSTTNAHTPLFGTLAANEAAADKLAQALFAQAASRIDLSGRDICVTSISVSPPLAFRVCPLKSPRDVPGASQ